MSSSPIRDFLLLQPCWTLFVLSLIPLGLKLLNKNKEPRDGIVFICFFLAYFSSFVGFFLQGFRGDQVFSLSLDVFNSGSAALVAFLSLLSFPFLFFSKDLERENRTEYLFLFTGSVIALEIFCLSTDFISSLVSLETASLVVYMLIGMSKKQTLSAETAMKYFILSSLSFGLFLFGVSFIFGATGNLEFLAITSDPIRLLNRFYFLGFSLILVGLLFKATCFPFVFWVRDIYEGAITPISNFLASVFKISIFLFLCKILLLPFVPLTSNHGTLFLQALGVLGIFTSLYGSLGALSQDKLKSLGAYSSITHSGYLLQAIAASWLLGFQSNLDLKFMFFYLTAYGISTIGFFTVTQFIESKISRPVKLEDLTGLFKSSPILAWAFSLFLLSLLGFPPTIGFFAKLAWLKPFILSSSWHLLFWAIVAQVISVYYYIKPITLMMKPKPQIQLGYIPIKMQIYLLIQAVFVCLGALGLGFFMG